MLDVKPWLESTGMKAAEECFSKPPPLPYITFSEEADIGGADDKNCISNRDISIQLYSEKINKDAEQKIEDLLNGKAIEFKKYRTWIDSESFVQTTYDFTLIEKM